MRSKGSGWYGHDFEQMGRCLSSLTIGRPSARDNLPPLLTLQAIKPRPIPRGPAPHILEDLLAVGQHPALDFPSCWRQRRRPPPCGRIHGVFRSSFAGPRFWHAGLIL